MIYLFFLRDSLMYVITGGGSGIGRALAHGLAYRNKQVCIIGRHEAPLIETAARYPSIRYVIADVSTEEGRETIIAQLQKETGLAGLIHNAGTIEPMTSLERLDKAAFQQVMATNLEAPLFLTQALQSVLTGARVLHIGSGAAYFPVKSWAAYCISKAALSMLTRCWQVDKPDIAVSSVMPGIIDTSMQALIRHAKEMAPEKQDFFNQLKQGGRLIQPDTVALFLTWLLLDVDTAVYVSKEWDIYDTSHHAAWLRAPYTVPPLD